jgi:NAD(P)-dependent dehydrogenase (short-subunit alcohol dehydrogenase family)
MRVVIIGGAGNFGARICTRLAQEPGIEAISTGRRARGTGGSRHSQTAALDIDSPHFEKVLRSLAPDLVIHCAGPFQGQDYRVALASLACGAHYLDLADGRRFVAGFVAAVGSAAETARRFAITGASTLPALSSAVIDALHTSFSKLNSTEVVIAPSQHAPRGAATVAAVLGYAGTSFQWRQDGQWRTVYGWRELKRQRFSFGRRLSAACDVPDLELFPTRYAGVQSVTFRAALEVSLQHYALWVLGACRRMGLPVPIARWGASLDRMGRWLNWLGSDAGGMTVRVTGKDLAGRSLSRTWELVAEGNHGPEIPCMAAVILASKLQRGEASMRGAKVCMGILGLSEFEAEFARWNISTRIVDTVS